MPMPLLNDVDKMELRKKLRQETQCHKCGKPCRYIHEDKVWCRTCLDIEQYPHLAHLTQEEREQMRLDAVARIKGPSVVNATNLAPSGIGFK